MENVFNPDEFVETSRSLFLRTKKVGLISTIVYDILESQGEIDLDENEKASIRERVEKSVSIRFFNASQLQSATKVANECKKQAVALYFLKMNEIDNL